MPAIRFSVQNAKALALPIVIAFLRLGRKYELDSLREEAIFRLSAHYPSTLTDFDNRGDTLSLIEDPDEVIGDVISLAYENGLHAILPAAYVICCQNYTFKDILQGKLIKLSAEERTTCLLGWKNIIDIQHLEVLTLIQPGPTPLCVRPGLCSEVKNALYRKITISGVTSVTPMEKLGCDWEVGLCSHCIAVRQGKHDICRKIIWESLPTWLELPKWEVLLKETWYVKFLVVALILSS